jgi:hypothetical protein
VVNQEPAALAQGTHRGNNRHTWLHEVEAKARPLHAVVHGLRNDLPAVRRAHSAHSDGPVEDANVKITFLRWQMYGNLGSGIQVVGTRGQGAWERR